jgi:hypothetical protein
MVNKMVWTGFMWLRIEPQLEAVVGVMLNQNASQNSGNFVTSSGPTGF